MNRRMPWFIRRHVTTGSSGGGSDADTPKLSRQRLGATSWTDGAKKRFGKGTVRRVNALHPIVAILLLVVLVQSGILARGGGVIARDSGSIDVGGFGKGGSGAAVVSHPGPGNGNGAGRGEDAVGGAGGSTLSHEGASRGRVTGRERVRERGGERQRAAEETREIGGSAEKEDKATARQQREREREQRRTGQHNAAGGGIKHTARRVGGGGGGGGGGDGGGGNALVDLPEHHHKPKPTEYASQPQPQPAAADAATTTDLGESLQGDGPGGRAVDSGDIDGDEDGSGDDQNATLGSADIQARGDSGAIEDPETGTGTGPSDDPAHLLEQLSTVLSQKYSAYIRDKAAQLLQAGTVSVAGIEELRRDNAIEVQQASVFGRSRNLIKLILMRLVLEQTTVVTAVAADPPAHAQLAAAHRSDEGGDEGGVGNGSRHGGGSGGGDDTGGGGTDVRRDTNTQSSATFADAEKDAQTSIHTWLSHTLSGAAHHDFGELKNVLSSLRARRAAGRDGGQQGGAGQQRQQEEEQQEGMGVGTMLTAGQPKQEAPQAAEKELGGQQLWFQSLPAQAQVELAGSAGAAAAAAAAAAALKHDDDAPMGADVGESAGVDAGGGAEGNAGADVRGDEGDALHVDVGANAERGTDGAKDRRRQDAGSGDSTTGGAAVVYIAVNQPTVEVDEETSTVKRALITPPTYVTPLTNAAIQSGIQRQQQQQQQAGSPTSGWGGRASHGGDGSGGSGGSGSGEHRSYRPTAGGGGSGGGGGGSGRSKSSTVSFYSGGGGGGGRIKLHDPASSADAAAKAAARARAAAFKAAASKIKTAKDLLDETQQAVRAMVGLGTLNPKP
jgi:hypothetical protein